MDDPSSKNLHARFKETRPEPATSGGQSFREFRTDAGGAEHAPNLSAFANAEAVKNEDVLHGNDVALHAGDFRASDDLASAVRETRHLDHGVNGRGALVADGAVRNVQVGHGDHVFDTSEGVA